ncbi:phytanoyl-CoA dioxygenase family protein [Agarivorans gilvus]|uniref:Phytanoyl-CoA dioxygenase n=1 Tax=Agarivorans gilvus TaxID=680279 RepID=A0ABQ1I2L2_9ALTE|nr:phytanoyl-CoA dioxygenase family protein [Agarivorans gilvus]GGB10521.1 hypothetical protein GCM10007414_24860 [Agarivorans gilvus]
MKENFKKNGIVIIPNVFDSAMLFRLKKELLAATKKNLSEQKADIFDKGMVHNCMLHGESMLALLDNPQIYHYVTSLFDTNAILYAYQSSTLMPHQSNYGTRIHVDSPRFINNYLTNIGLIIPLDDFTEENGATYYLPGSHLNEKLPDEEYFRKNAKRAICKKGNLIIFNARLVHAAGTNNSNQERCALTMNFCRSYMRQRFDFPRLVPNEIINKLGNNGRQFLGMNVRMPTSLEEFYLPEEQRLYKPNQG